MFFSLQLGENGDLRVETFFTVLLVIYYSKLQAVDDDYLCTKWMHEGLNFSTLDCDDHSLCSFWSAKNMNIFIILNIQRFNL